MSSAIQEPTFTFYLYSVYDVWHKLATFLPRDDVDIAKCNFVRPSVRHISALLLIKSDRQTRANTDGQYCRPSRWPDKYQMKQRIFTYCCLFVLMCLFFRLRDFVVMSAANITQGNRILHFALAVHSRHPFRPIGDAVYRQHARRGPSHGHRQHAQKFGKDCACGSGDILADRLIDRQTYRKTYSSQYFATAPADEVTTSVLLHGVRWLSALLFGTTFCSICVLY